MQHCDTFFFADAVQMLLSGGPRVLVVCIAPPFGPFARCGLVCCRGPCTLQGIPSEQKRRFGYFEPFQQNPAVLNRLAPVWSRPKTATVFWNCAVRRLSARLRQSASRCSGVTLRQSLAGRAAPSQRSQLTGRHVLALLDSTYDLGLRLA